MKVEIERRGDVIHAFLNDPETLNAVDTGMVEALDRALDDLGDARCLVIGGRGRAFSSGANLSAEQVVNDAGAMLESHVNPLMTRLRDLPVPWISSVHGAAAGVGCALALAADLIVASDASYFLQAFVRVGLVPDGGSSFLLTRTIGRPRAMEMMLLGERVAAQQALDWGLVNRVVPDDRLEEETQALAERLAAGPTRSIGLIRRTAWTATDAGWDETLAAERASQRVAGRTRDFGEGVAAFLAKRPARFTGA